MASEFVHGTWVILKREYAQRVHSRSFIVSTILVPLIPVGIIAAAIWMSRSASHAPPMQVPPSAAASHVAGSTAGAAFMTIILLYVMFGSLFTYGAIVMRAVIEEKQSRVVEVLLCFASPEELMTGKLLGVGAVALTQVLVWIALAITALAFSPMLRAAAAAMGLGPAAVVYFVVFDALGYLLYSAMFCAIGAAFNSPDEAQQWVIFLAIPLVFIGMLISTLITRPGAPSVVVASIVPFTAPALLYARMLLMPPPWSQVALSIGLLVVSIVVLVRLCAGIYRVGILMYGKKPTAREIIRWLRYTS